MAGVVLKFQSTPPRRGATRCSSDLRWVPQNFNPRPREGGRRCGIAGAVQGIAISIHAPARGGDRYDRAASLTAWYFNPRPREVQVTRDFREVRKAFPEKTPVFLRVSQATTPHFSPKTQKFYFLVKDPQVKLCIFAVAPPRGGVD